MGASYPDISPLMIELSADAAYQRALAVTRVTEQDGGSRVAMRSVFRVARIDQGVTASRRRDSRQQFMDCFLRTGRPRETHRFALYQRIQGVNQHDFSKLDIRALHSRDRQDYVLWTSFVRSIRSAACSETTTPKASTSSVAWLRVAASIRLMAMEPSSPNS